MYIHIGGKRIVSGESVIGIFNSETIKLSENNKSILSHLNAKDKSVVIKSDNSVITSIVSPFTIIKRLSIDTGCIWRRDNEC